MTYRLSLLEKSPVFDDETGSIALARSVALAQNAERWGYHRFWVAEHHGMAGVASASPEVLAAYILASTSRIRIGSGGVLLQHYSPYKVAENFHVLASLAPGRVDLGIGKAPGGLPLATRALQWGHDPAVRRDFSTQLRQLGAYLDHGTDPGLALDRPLATPLPPEAPERFLLGGSPESARLAAEQGWQFVFAGQLNGDHAAIEASIEAFAKAGGPGTPLLAVTALAAESNEEAERIADGLRIVRLHLDDGQALNVGSEEQAAEYARQAGVTSYRTELRRPSIVAGTPARVRRELDALHRRFGISEFILDTPAAARQQRLASIALLADEVLAAAA